MTRRYYIGRVKLHRSYILPEAATLLGVHKHTLSRWIDDGLPVFKDKKPYLVLGSDLRAYLKARRPKKQPCRPGEIYCVSCRAPKRPAGDMADFVPLTADRGFLRGICPDCDRIINRLVSTGTLAAVGGPLAIARQPAQSRMCDSPAPVSNVDFPKVTK